MVRSFPDFPKETTGHPSILSPWLLRDHGPHWISQKGVTCVVPLVSLRGTDIFRIQPGGHREGKVGAPLKIQEGLQCPSKETCHFQTENNVAVLLR